jgi:hypothetical protein
MAHKAIDIAKPTMLAIFYEDNSVEFRNIREGIVLESFIPSRKDIDDIYNTIVESDDTETVTIRKRLLPFNCISVLPYRVYYYPVTRRKFFVAHKNSLIEFHVWMPP